MGREPRRARGKAGVSVASAIRAWSQVIGSPFGMIVYRGREMSCTRRRSRDIGALACFIPAMHCQRNACNQRDCPEPECRRQPDRFHRRMNGSLIESGMNDQTVAPPLNQTGGRVKSGTGNGAPGWDSNPRIPALQADALATSPPVLSVFLGLAQRRTNAIGKSSGSSSREP